MKITRDVVADIAKVIITDNGYQCEYNQVGDVSQFEFEGKVPSRRLMRELMKEVLSKEPTTTYTP